MKLARYVGITFLIAFTSLFSIPSQAAATRRIAAQDSTVIPILDEFGYTWAVDSAGWFDAPGQVEFPLGDSVSASSAVALGFPFRFYDRTYSSIALFGTGSPGISFIPNATPTEQYYRNFIRLGFNGNVSLYEGKVFTATGGIAPNRYFLVQWINATLSFCSHAFCNYYQPFDLQILLQENGDVVIHSRAAQFVSDQIYLSMCDWAGVSRVGVGLPIQSSTRLDARIFRPPPQARVLGAPASQGQLIHPNTATDFNFTVQNRGDASADTFEVALSSTWPVTLYASGGVLPLTDTNGNGSIDTGPINRGEVITYVAKLIAPPEVGLGTWSTATLTLSSAQEITRQSQIALQAAVPASFVMSVIHGTGGDRAEFDWIDPLEQHVTALPDSQFSTLDVGLRQPPEIAELPSGGYFIAKIINGEIVHAIMNDSGQLVTPVRQVAVPGLNYISLPENPFQIAVAPNGRIGILGTRLMDASGYERAPFVFVLDRFGNLVSPITTLDSLKSNASWMPLQIAATADSRWVVASITSRTPGFTGNNLLFTDALDEDGNVTYESSTSLTRNADDVWEMYNLRLTAVDDHIIATFDGRTINWPSRQLFAVALNQVGQVVAPFEAVYTRTFYTAVEYGISHRAARMANGQLGLVWIDREDSRDEHGNLSSRQRVSFAAVDSTGTRTVTPTVVAEIKDDIQSGVVAGLEVIPDAAGHLLVFWRIPSNPATLQLAALRYMLLNGDGTVLTPPTTIENPSPKDDLSTIYSESASYRFASRVVNQETAVHIRVDAPAWVGVAPNGRAGIPLHVTNQSLVTATHVMMTMTLGAGVSYIGGLAGPPLTMTTHATSTVLVWTLPDMRLLNETGFHLAVRVPDAPYAAELPVQVEVSASDPAGDPSLRTVVQPSLTRLWVSRQIYLPTLGDSP